MKYKEVKKVSPMPGRFNEVIPKIISAVDSPANQQPFLVVKGKKMLTEVQKKEMREAGLTEDEIKKAESEGEQDSTWFSKMKKFWSGDKTTPAATPSTSEPLILEAITKAVEKTIDSKLAALKKNEEPAPATDDELDKEIEDLEAKIAEADTSVQKSLTDKEKKLQELQKKYETLQKARMGSNAGSNEGSGQNLDPESVAKRKIDEIFEGTALSD